jgi:hypothetical protein
MLVEPDSGTDPRLIVFDSGATVSVLRSLAPVHLLDRAGGAASATLDSIRVRPSGCRIVSLRGRDARALPAAVGFFTSGVAGIPADSASTIAPTDSAQLASTVAALASAIPGDTAGRFTGLPFVLVSLWRLRLPNQGTLALATHRRVLPQEAAPLEERTLLIAQRQGQPGEYSTVYSQWVEGREETVETTEFVAAFVPAGGRPTILLRRDYGATSGYALLTQSDSHWVVTWSARAQRC